MYMPETINIIRIDSPYGNFHKGKTNENNRQSTSFLNEFPLRGLDSRTQKLMKLLFPRQII